MGNPTVQDAGGSLTTYTRDAESRITLIALPDDTVQTMTYDATGMRRKKQTAAATTAFVWDGQDVLLETNGNGSTQARYTLTPDGIGLLIAQRRDSATSFYHFDALGSAVGLTDTNETQTDTYRYYAFGELLTSTGSTENPYRYVGRLGYYNEPTLALQYLRARWYRPRIGRFIRPDPVVRSDQYVYAWNGPLDHADAFGLAPYVDWLQHRYYFAWPKHKQQVWAGHGSVSPIAIHSMLRQTLLNWIGYFQNRNPPWRDAARHARHFLSNSGDDLWIDVKRMSRECEPVKHRIREEIIDARTFAQGLQYTGPPGTVQHYRIGNPKWGSGSAPKDPCGNWWAAVHGFEILGVADVYLTGPGTGCMDMSVYVFDTWDFDRSVYKQLHLAGIGKFYRILGEYKLYRITL